jgi:transposase
MRSVILCRNSNRECPNHPLRLIRRIVNEILVALDGQLEAVAADGSITSERVLRALLLQAFYSMRSERKLME